MSINRGLFVRNLGTVGTNPKDARLALAGLLAEDSPGVPRQGLLDQVNPLVVTGATGWTYNVRPCTLVTSRGPGDGAYVFSFSGSTAVGTDAAPGSGFRYDLIWAKQNDPDKGDNDGASPPKLLNSAMLGVTKGTAASSPAKPYADVPDGAYVIAESLVPANTTGTNKATIEQVWKHTATRGAPVKVRDATERASLPQVDGALAIRLDQGGRLEQRVGGVWGSSTKNVPFTTAAGAATGWANVSGALPFRVDKRDGCGWLNGYVVRSTGTNTLIATIPAGYRPKSDLTFDVASENSSFGAGPTFRIYVTAASGAVVANRLGSNPPSWNNGTTKLPICVSYPLA